MMYLSLSGVRTALHICSIMTENQLLSLHMKPSSCTPITNIITYLEHKRLRKPNGRSGMDNQEWTIKNGQSRMNNQEWTIKNGQSRMGNQE